MSLATPVRIHSDRSIKGRYIKIDHVPTSQLPYRVEKRSNGLVLGRFETRDQADTFVDELCLGQLKKKPTRRNHR